MTTLMATLETTVSTVDHARLATAEVCRVLRRVGGIDLDDGSWIDLSLRTPAQLRRAAPSPYCPQPRGTASFTRSRSAEGEVVSTYRINVERGLPLREFSACCAHELGHIYQYRTNVPRLPAFLSEGLCELFKLTWYTGEGVESAGKELRRMWANPDPVYGYGFRQVLPALLGRRLSDVMRYVTTYGQLPPPMVEGQR